MTIMWISGVQRLTSILVTILCVLGIDGSLPKDNMLIGIKFLNYTNYYGAIASGQCCDDASISAPNCPPNQCDTSFQPCGQRNSKTKCDVFPSNAYPTMFNNNSFVVDKVIGNGVGLNTSSSLTVFKIPFSTDTMYFNISAYEMSNNTKEDIATWNFQVDWVDPLFKGQPDWREFLLKDSQAELGLKVVSQCEKHCYGPTCSIYCDPTSRYDCFDNGTKDCKTGWTGKECDIMIDHCVGHSCENGATCSNSLTGYTCSCPPLFTGQYCEIDLSTTTTTAQTPASSTLPATTTTVVSTTTPSTTTEKVTISTTTVTVMNTTLPSVIMGTVSSKPKGVKQKSEDSSYTIWIVIGVIGILALITGMAAGGYYYKKKSGRKVRPDSPIHQPESPNQMSHDTNQNPERHNIFWEEDPMNAW